MQVKSNMKFNFLSLERNFPSSQSMNHKATLVLKKQEEKNPTLQINLGLH